MREAEFAGRVRRVRDIKGSGHRLDADPIGRRGAELTKRRRRTGDVQIATRPAGNALS